MKDFLFSHSRIRRNFFHKIHVANLLMIAFVAISFSYDGASLYMSYGIALLAYVAVMLFLVFRWLSYKNNHPSITLEADQLILPRLLFPGREKTIDLSLIYSVQFIEPKKQGVIVGLRGKLLVMIEAQWFQKKEDFIELATILELRAKRNAPAEDAYELQQQLSTRQSKYLNLDIGTAFMVAVFLMVYALLPYDPLSGTLAETVSTLGANAKAKIAHGELYRLFSYFFIHINFLHLMTNILSIAVISRALESTVGSIRFFNLIFVSALSAALLSFALSTHQASIGASGGFFGLLGAFVVIRLKYSQFLPASIKLFPGWVLCLLLSIELIVSYFVGVIDGAAHLGGFLAGMLYGKLVFVGTKPHDLNQPKTAEKILFIAFLLANALGVGYFLYLL